ncbi:hypothetical protein [Pseudoalteromonas sp. T1lg23B]|uniref:hypothetical protein n=1 Tax=Pseudoalteromonas sp. T1lg23B TaxID=2077097 RepID=UPI000CF73E4B|nr:hypothetical protein [Pseudoalteromonas sp. T1lg23B]
MEFRRVQLKMPSNMKQKSQLTLALLQMVIKGGNQQMLIATNKHNDRLPILKFSSKLKSLFIN